MTNVIVVKENTLPLWEYGFIQEHISQWPCPQCVGETREQLEMSRSVGNLLGQSCSSEVETEATQVCACDARARSIKNDLQRRYYAEDRVDILCAARLQGPDRAEANSKVRSAGTVLRQVRGGMCEASGTTAVWRGKLAGVRTTWRQTRWSTTYSC
jgi:hypothetical protein